MSGIRSEEKEKTLMNERREEGKTRGQQKSI
jgi:hypothetical protein